MCVSFGWVKDPNPLFCTACLCYVCVCVSVCAHVALPFSAHSVCHDKYICLCFTGWHRLWLAGTAVLAPGPWACVCAQPSDSFHGSLHPRSPHPPSSPLQKSSQTGAATRTPCLLWVLLSGAQLCRPPPRSLDLLSRMRATALHYLLLRLSPSLFTLQKMEWSLPTHHAFFSTFNYDFVIVSATPFTRSCGSPHYPWRSAAGRLDGPLISLPCFPFSPSFSHSKHSPVGESRLNGQASV